MAPVNIVVARVEEASKDALSIQTRDLATSNDEVITCCPVSRNSYPARRSHCGIF